MTDHRKPRRLQSVAQPAALAAARSAALPALLNGGLLLAGLLLAGLLLTGAGLAETRTPVATFSGTDDTITATFTVGDAWSVEWSTEDQRANIVLKGTGTGIPSLTANPVDPGSGQAIYARGGTYHFEVEAQGPWRIEVFDD